MEPTEFAEGVEELFLLHVPVCVWGGEGHRLESYWNNGLRAGIRPVLSYTVCVVHKGLEVEPEIIPF